LISSKIQVVGHSIRYGLNYGDLLNQNVARVIAAYKIYISIFVATVFEKEDSLDIIPSRGYCTIRLFLEALQHGRSVGIKVVLAVPLATNIICVTVEVVVTQ